MNEDEHGLSHEELWAACERMLDDHGGYGHPDNPHNPQCVSCLWFHILWGPRGADWGVCGNPDSHRAGLLTFEHMGCGEFEYDDRLDSA